MKYKKYDIVKVIKPYWEDYPSDSHIGKEAIITKVSGGYEITFLDGGGSSAWWHDRQLSFIKEGNEDVVKAARIKFDEKVRLAQSWDWIKEHWKDNTISTASMSFLMNEIGYHSAFEFNGEYYALFMDFRILYPIFNYLFEGKLDDALKTADKVFKSHCLDKVKQNIIKCYQKIYK
jgi:hypothetical protein